jgi:hypothetical protein
MSKKKLVYKKTKGAIDTQDAALKAIQALDIAGLLAQENDDAKAMATVGLGWAVLSHTVFNIETGMRTEMEIADLQSETERIVNKVGFGPRYEEDEDDDN